MGIGVTKVKKSKSLLIKPRYNVIREVRKRMVKHGLDSKWIIGKSGIWAALGGACWFLGIIFAVLGIISAAMNTTLVSLTPEHWFLLSIAAFVASIPEYIGWAVAVYLNSIESKK